ncbi:hypothetical protein DESA109040_10650 [Deinococcus saxicola]|uniref:hypothetical protein n=1 Tax=Deinococcus saxicola TaxID=249406 RepID=UPI0039F013DE
MQQTPVQETKVEGLGVKRRRLKPMTIDWGPFFLYFGVSGTDHTRAERMEKRFELEHFANLVTLTLSVPLTPGSYTLRGLPDEANKRGWTVGAGGRSASGPLSDDGLTDLRAWMAGRERRVQAAVVAPPA